MIGNVLAGYGQIGGVLATGRIPSAGFVGAYDAIPSIVAAYGMRRLLTTYTGSLLRLRRSSDSTEQDIGYTAAGHLDTDAVATFIGGGSGYIRTWYDQSGNTYDAGQATAANQPLYVASGQNGKPVGRGDGSNDYLASVIGPALGDFFVLALYKAIAIAPGGYDRIIDKDYVLGFWIGRAASAASSWGGGVLESLPPYGRYETFPDNQWNMIASRRNGTVHTIYRNGLSVITGFVSATVTSTEKFSIFGRSLDLNQCLAGDIAELIICNAALSDANRIAAEAAANAYWAIY